MTVKNYAGHDSRARRYGSSFKRGVGPLHREEGIANLVRAFPFGGAKSMVASLWALQRHLYHHCHTQPSGRNQRLTPDCRFKTGMATSPPVNQQSAIDNRPFHGHAIPFYWAAFIMVGDFGLSKGGYSKELFGEPVDRKSDRSTTNTGKTMQGDDGSRMRPNS